MSLVHDPFPDTESDDGGVPFDLEIHLDDWHAISTSPSASEIHASISTALSMLPSTSEESTLPGSHEVSGALHVDASVPGQGHLSTIQGSSASVESADTSAAVDGANQSEVTDQSDPPPLPSVPNEVLLISSNPEPGTNLSQQQNTNLNLLPTELDMHMTAYFLDPFDEPFGTFQTPFVTFRVYPETVR